MKQILKVTVKGYFVADGADDTTIAPHATMFAIRDTDEVLDWTSFMELLVAGINNSVAAIPLVSVRPMTEEEAREHTAQHENDDMPTLGDALRDKGMMQ